MTSELLKGKTVLITGSSRGIGSVTAKLAKKNGLDPAQMALSYVTSRPFLTSNIIGATSMEQLKIDIESINIELSNDVIKEIESIHEKIPNPSP